MKTSVHATSFVAGVYSIRKFVPLLVICLSVFAGNLRADDDLYQTPDDLSPADKVAAEHLQKQIDAQEKAAHDKAEKDYEKAHSSGGSATGLIFPAMLVFLMVGIAIYGKNRTAGKVYAAGSFIVIAGLIVVGVIDDHEQSHPDMTASENVSEIVSNALQVEAEASEKQRAEDLKSELASSKDELAKKTQRLKWVKLQVTYYYRQYIAYEAYAPPPTMPEETKNNKYYCDKWSEDFTNECEDYISLIKRTRELEKQVYGWPQSRIDPSLCNGLSTGEIDPYGTNDTNGLSLRE